MTDGEDPTVVTRLGGDGRRPTNGGPTAICINANPDGEPLPTRTPSYLEAAASTAPLPMSLRPPKLEKRIREYGIAMPTFAPVFDRVFVYPTDRQDLPESTAGGIILAESTKTRLGAQRGILIAAGPIAIEQLYGHGISLGDIVLVARFSPWDRAYMGVKAGDTRASMHRMMVLRAAEVVGSEDLLTALEAGELQMEMDSDGRVQIHDRQRVDPPTNDEGI